jgi:serine/threonine-protein kinase RsbW
MQIIDYKLEAYISYKVDCIEKLLNICEQVIENITADEKVRFKLKSALHELITNSIEHGYNKGSGKITVSFKREKESIVFEIADEGRGFDIASMNLDRTLEDIDRTTARGWGLIITQNLSENMSITPNTPSGIKITIVVPI